MFATLPYPRPSLCACMQLYCTCTPWGSGLCGTWAGGWEVGGIASRECDQEKLFSHSSFSREMVFEVELPSARLDSKMRWNVQVWARAGRERTLGRNPALSMHHGSPPPAKEIGRWLLTRYLRYLNSV